MYNLVISLIIAVHHIHTQTPSTNITIYMYIDSPNNLYERVTTLTPHFSRVILLDFSRHSYQRYITRLLSS